MLNSATSVDLKSNLKQFQLDQIIPALIANNINFKCYGGRTIEVCDFDATTAAIAPFYELESCESDGWWTIVPSKSIAHR